MPELPEVEVVRLGLEPAVAGATVVVKDEKTGQERTVLSNAEGRYLVTNLKPSRR